MKKTKIKIPAKINLTLDINGVKDGYHTINSLVASVGVFDTVIAKKRKDNFISVVFQGLSAEVEGTKSNAYFAALAFQKEFSVKGADIIIKRDIPAGAGLGGSSADIAGVLLALAKLYGIKSDLYELASSLGSDVWYMMGGGFAVISGRGEKVEKLCGVKKPLYLLIVKGSAGVSTSKSYSGYDKIGKTYPCVTASAAEALVSGETERFLGILKNDLYESSARILPEIADTLAQLKKLGAAVMTGSGSAVVGVYTAQKSRDKAYKALVGRFCDRLIKTKTL